MKKNRVNLKFLGLSLAYLLTGILCRIFFLNGFINAAILSFCVGLLVPSFIFYFFASFRISSHRYQRVLFFAVGLLAMHALIYFRYDDEFIARCIGLVASMALCRLTFIGKVNRWFTGEVDKAY